MTWFFNHICNINTVDYRLFVTWFNDNSDLTSRFLWSQILIGFCYINFTWFNDTWYNSQTWFKVAIFRSPGYFLPDIVILLLSTLCYFFLQSKFPFIFWYILKVMNTNSTYTKIFNIKLYSSSHKLFMISYAYFVSLFEV